MQLVKKLKKIKIIIQTKFKQCHSGEQRFTIKLTEGRAPSSAGWVSGCSNQWVEEQLEETEEGKTSQRNTTEEQLRGQFLS